MKHAATVDLSAMVDVLVACIVLLVAIAFASEVDTLEVDQQLVTTCGRPGPHAPPPPPPLLVHLTASGVAIGRSGYWNSFVPRDGASVVWPEVEGYLAADRLRFPEEHEVVLVTNDGVAYTDMIGALDRTRAHGYERHLLGGGPAGSW